MMTVLISIKLSADASFIFKNNILCFLMCMLKFIIYNFDLKAAQLNFFINILPTILLVVKN